MKEVGEIRKRLSDEEAAPYIGFARLMLGTMKDRMVAGGLRQLKWAKDLPNGVRVTVSSIFGQDEIRISVPTNIALSTSSAQQVHLKYESSDEVIFGDAKLSSFKWVRKDGVTYLSNTFTSQIYAVSADGDTVVGTDYLKNPYKAFRWTQKDGFVFIHDLDNGEALTPYAVSGDGSIIAGQSNNGGFVWSEADGVTSICDYSAVGISVDGSVVVGNTSDGNVVLWTKSGGAKVIGAFVATGISADGSTVVGSTGPLYDPASRAAWWSKKTGMVVIPPIYSGTYNSEFAKAASEDGSVIVGGFYYEEGGWGHTHPFRWTAKTGMVDIGVFPSPEYLHNSNSMVAQGVSPDGSVIVGQGVGYPTGAIPYSWMSFRWTEKTGIESLGTDTGKSGGITVIAAPTKYFVDNIQVDKTTYDAA